MARKPRICPAGYTQHIVQRGNNRSVCFASDDDYIAYAHWLQEAADKYGIAVHAWVLMTNHVHLLITPSEENTVSLLMQYLGRYYVRRFNFTYKRTGTLWEGRYKSSLVDSDRYVLACYRYIEMNPVMANMVTSPADYRWSSYHANARGIDSACRTPHPCYLGLSQTKVGRRVAYKKLFDHVDAGYLDAEIAWGVKKGLAAGSAKFKAEIEALTEVTQELKPRGPKKGFRKEFLL